MWRVVRDVGKWSVQLKFISVNAHSISRLITSVRYMLYRILLHQPITATETARTRNISCASGVQIEHDKSRRHANYATR